MCLADAETYLQVTYNECDVWIEEDDLDFDNIQNAFYYYIPGEGSFYFDSDYIGAPAPSGQSGTKGNDDDGHKSGTKGNDDDGHKSGRKGNDDDHGNSRSRQRRHYRHSSHRSSHGNDNDHANTGSGSGSGSGTNNGNTVRDWDNWNISPLNFTYGNTTYCVNKTGTRGNNINIVPQSNVIVINVTIDNSTNTTVIIVDTAPATIVTALQDDPSSNFEDQYGNDAFHVEIVEDLIEKRTQFENQLDNEIQHRGINAQRQSDVQVSAQQNIIKIETTFLYPQGATEDDKNKSCNALADTAESQSNLKYSRDCDFINLAQTNSKRQAGDYLMITTYSIDSHQHDSGAIYSLSIFVLLIALLTCNF